MLKERIFQASGSKAGAAAVIRRPAAIDVEINCRVPEFRVSEALQDG